MMESVGNSPFFGMYVKSSDNMNSTQNKSQDYQCTSTSGKSSSQTKSMTYYKRNKDSINSKRRKKYAEEKVEKVSKSQVYYEKNKDAINAKRRNKYSQCKGKLRKDGQVQSDLKVKINESCATRLNKRNINCEKNISNGQNKYCKFNADHFQANSFNCFDDKGEISKESFLKSVDPTAGVLHKQSWVIKNMHKFHDSMKMEINQCIICKEAWPKKVSSKKEENFTCLRCKRDKGTPKKFSSENSMIPSAVPEPLVGLTQIEEMLIARAFPVMQIYTKPRGGQHAYKGHVITLPNDVQKIANILPRLSSDLPVLIFRFNQNDNQSKDLIVRRQNVLDALTWLTGKDSMGAPNNPLYSDIIIDLKVLNS